MAETGSIETTNSPLKESIKSQINELSNIFATSPDVTRQDLLTNVGNVVEEIRQIKNDPDHPDNAMPTTYLLADKYIGRLTGQSTDRATESLKASKTSIGTVAAKIDQLVNTINEFDIAKKAAGYPESESM